VRELANTIQSSIKLTPLFMNVSRLRSFRGAEST
jgi:hypothetical protein